MASQLTKFSSQLMASDNVDQMYCIPQPMDPGSVPSLDNDEQKWFLTPIFHTLQI